VSDFSPSIDAVVDVLRQTYLETGLVSQDDFAVAAAAFGELLEGAEMFERFSRFNKVAVFGSARTKPSHPLYKLAVDFSRLMAQRGWLVVSGAGPGIMEAASKGAGIENTLGVNIELPFEQFPNPYIDTATKLVEMDHFFTRKVSMTRPSNAFVVLPGGFGTLDEAFEVLTLLHTGKTEPAPVVLLDQPGGEMDHFFTRKVSMTRPSNAFVVLPGGFGTLDEAFEVLTLLHTGKTEPAPVVLLDQPGGTFWRRLEEFIQDEIIDGQYINKPDLALLRVCDTAEGAVREVLNFFKNYREVRFTPGMASIRVHQLPNTDQLETLRKRFPVFVRDSGFRTNGHDTLSFDFDGRNYVNLRLVIDFLNDLVP